MSCSHQQSPPVFKVVQEGGQRPLRRRCWPLGWLWVFLLFRVFKQLLSIFLSADFALFSRLSSPSFRFLGGLVILFLLFLHLVVLVLQPLGRADFSESVRFLGMTDSWLAGYVLVLILICQDLEKIIKKIDTE